MWYVYVVKPGMNAFIMYHQPVLIKPKKTLTTEKYPVQIYKKNEKFLWHDADRT